MKPSQNVRKALQNERTPRNIVASPGKSKANPMTVNPINITSDPYTQQIQANSKQALWQLILSKPQQIIAN